MKTKYVTTIKEYTYNEYRKLVLDLAEKNETTGPEQSTERIHATKINAQRIRRIDKTIILNEELTFLIRSINRKWRWTVLVESWCGDGAQNVPIIAKIASLNENIELTFLLRDENLNIMDQYLTNGSRSIPILICTDISSGIIIGTWGPRPAQIAEMVKIFKEEKPTVPHDEFVQHLHLWYAKDKGLSLQQDLISKIHLWKNSFIPE